jgi:hypothetical protein
MYGYDKDGNFDMEQFLGNRPSGALEKIGPAGGRMEQLSDGVTLETFPNGDTMKRNAHGAGLLTTNNGNSLRLLDKKELEAFDTTKSGSSNFIKSGIAELRARLAKVTRAQVHETSRMGGVTGETDLKNFGF